MPNEVDEIAGVADCVCVRVLACLKRHACIFFHCSSEVKRI